MSHPEDFVRQVIQNLNLDPAKVFPPATAPGSPAPPQASDPISKRLEVIESQLTRDRQTQQQRAVSEARANLTQFADEKGPDGQPLHPHFENVKIYMGRLMAADPDLDLKGAYEIAVYRDPELRKTVVSSAPATSTVPPTTAGTVPVDMDKVRRGQEAAAAAKANRKGSGNGAAPPAVVPGKMSLQEALSAAADEVGMK